MHITLLAITFAATFCLLSIATSAQTVQLPTTQQFSVNTTVSVPDGGSALLGGVSTARSGTQSRSVPILGRLPGVGPLFNNRAYGSDVGVSQSRVRAQIIDHREWDEAILGQARNRRSKIPQQRNVASNAAPDPVVRRAAFLTKFMGRSSKTPQTQENRFSDSNSSLAKHQPEPTLILKSQ